MGVTLNGSFEGDVDIGVGTDIHVDVDSGMAVSINCGSFKRGLGLLPRGFGG